MSTSVNNLVLTEAQKETLEKVYLKKWFDISIDCKEGDKVKAEKAIVELYALAGLPAPEIAWAKNIKEGAQLVVKRTKQYFKEHPEELNGQTVEDICRDNKRAWLCGNFWGGYAAWVDFYNTEQPEKGQTLPTCYMDISREIGYFFTLDKLCVITEKPIEINLDNRNRLHSSTGMSIKYKSSDKSGVWGVYSIHGIKIENPDFIIDPSKLTVDKIEKENNAEVRRVMIELYGQDRYVQDANFKVVDEDTDPSGFPRQLLKKEQRDDETLLFVKLHNSSLELDGTRKIYFIQCHPELRPIKTDAKGNAALIPNAQPQKETAHNAVASLFGLYGHEYGLNGQYRQGDVLLRFFTGKATEMPFQES